MLYFRTILISILFSLSTIQAATPNEMRVLWKKVMEQLPEYPENDFEGKGIVIAAGGEYYLLNAWIALNVLRYQGCQLPVEIWYIGEEEYIPHWMEKLESLGAKCCDVMSVFDYPIRGWEVKAHAILASSFQEVMLLDADNVVLANPDYLFDSEQYANTGTLFWPDVSGMGYNNILWEVLELKPRNIRAQESGIVMIDKKRCWEAINLCVHMNKESHFYYQHMYGDKDTFFLSCMATKTPYSMVQHLPGLVFRVAGLMPFSSFLQRDCEGNPLFCHTVLQNWSERTNFETYWRYYTLPSQSIDELFPTYPFGKEVNRVFRRKFKNIEDVCLGFLREVKSFDE